MAASLLPDLKKLIDLAVETEAELADSAAWQHEVRDLEVERR